MIVVQDRAGARKTLEPGEGKTLMPVLRPAKVGIIGLCNGNAVCGTCHVYVDADWLGRLPEPEDFEIEKLEELEHRQENSRLSCQLIYEPGLDGLGLSVAPLE